MTRPADLTPGQTIRRMGDDVTVISVERVDHDTEWPYRVKVAQWLDLGPENHATIWAREDTEFRV